MIHSPATAVVLAIVFCTVSGRLYAEPPASHHTGHAASELKLSTGLGELFRTEMAALQEGMRMLFPAIVAGDWEAVAATGARLRDSFILQQELTPAQAAELHRSVPAAFLDLDRSFHRSAGMLVDAAKMKNPEVTTFYFYKLTDACVSCHSKFATHRFPGLADAGTPGAHRH